MAEISRQGIRIAYDVVGRGRPLLLMHGWGSDRTWWIEAGYIAALRDHFTVVNIDLRGHGASDKPHQPSMYRTEEVVGDLLAVADAEGIDRFAVWGMSYGGWIAWMAGDRAFPRVTAVISAGFWNPVPDSVDDWADFDASCGQALRRDGTVGLINLYRLVDGDDYGREYPPWAEEVTLRADPQALLAIESRELHALGTGFFGSGISSFEDYPVPVLLLAGALEDPDDQAAENAARIPRGESLRLPGLGHSGALAASSLALPTAQRFLSAWFGEGEHPSN